MDKYLKFIDAKEKLIFITPHMLLENEKAYLEKQFKNCEFYKFADFLSDKDNEECDYLAYEKQKKNGENPVFKTGNIGLEYETDYWS